MPAIGSEVADAYIEVHASTGPFRRELRREATLAAREASDDFGTEFTKAIDRDLDPLGAKVAESLREMGELGGRGLIDEIADQVRSRAGRINSAFAESITFGDFAPFIEQFRDLDNAIEDFDTRLRELNKDGTLTNDTFDRLNAAFNAYIRTIQDSAIADALARDREEAVRMAEAADRVSESLNRTSESTRRFNIGLGGLKGSRNDFLNFLGTLSGFLERNIARGLEGLFSGVGRAVTGLGQSLSGINGPLGSVGRGLDSFGQSISRVGGGGLDGLLVQIGALLLALEGLFLILGPIAGGVSGLAASFVALGTAVGGAIGGGLLALGPGILALAAGVTAASLAFSKMDKATKAAFAPLKDWTTEIRTVVQEQLFQNLSANVQRFSGLLSGINPLLAASAGEVRRFGENLISAFTAGPVQESLNTLGSLLPSILRSLLSTLTSLSVGLTGLFAGAAPAADRLFASIARVVQQFAAWATSAEGQRQINAFMDQAVVILGSLWTLITQVAGVFRTFWQEGATSGQAIVDNLVKIVTQFNAWLGSTAGREALSQWFRDGVRILNTLGVAVSELIKLFDALDTGSTRAAFQFLIASISSIIVFFRQAASAGIAFGEFVVNATLSVGRAMNAVGGAISAVIRWFGSLGSVGTSVARSISNFILAIPGAIGGIGRAISGAITAFSVLQARALAALSGILSRVHAIGFEIINGIINGISSGVGRLYSYVAGIASNIAGTFADVLGIASPSKVFRDLGGFIVLGLIDGMQRREREAHQQGDQIANSVINGAQDGLRRASGSLRNTARIITDALAAAGDAPRVDKAFQELGVRAIRSLTNGLDNGREEAQSEIQDIVQRISEVAREAMKGEDKKTRASIVAQSAALQQWVRSQGQALDAVWREVDRAGVRLDAARQRLQELQQDYVQMRDQVADSLRGELDLGGAIQTDGTATFEQVASQVSGLAARMKTFARLLKRLVSEGFPPALVQEVAALGTTEGITIARALLSGTEAQQRDLIADFGAIQTASTAAGTVLAEQMFRLGIEAQKGLIKGLEANQAALISAAKRIAKTITNEIKRELGIKSPSTVFRQLGEFIVEGLALGIESGTDRVAGAVSGLVDTNALNNLNAPVSSLAAGQTASGGTSGVPGVAAGAITIVTPYANPRLVAIEALDALAARGK